MDAAINGTADATQEVYSQADTILVLICQLFVRVACFLTVVGLLASSRQWRDEYLLQYSGVFCVSLGEGYGVLAFNGLVVEGALAAVVKALLEWTKVRPRDELCGPG